MMAGGIAHEINSPLATICLNAEMIQANAEKTDIDPIIIAKKAETIISTVKRIGVIITGLKTFSIDTNLVDAKEFTVRHLLESTLDLCREKLKYCGIELHVDETHFPVLLFGKSVEISQVLLNLLGNSLDATASSKSPWIKIESRLNNSCLQIGVIDSGPGIPPELVKNLFQPFFTTKEISKGTGLGLSLSLGLVQKHGGSLFYDGTGVNTRFVIELPVVQSMNDGTASKIVI